MNSLFRLPGPTPLPPLVIAAMQRPMIPHRGSVFSDFYTDLLRRLQKAHRTNGEIIVWPSSGSAGWEIGLVNLLQPGEAVLSVSCGDFGDRYRAVARQLGYDVRCFDVAWGSTLTTGELSKALETHSDVKAVLLTHNETSTGATNPLSELSQVVRDHGALLLVDAVSSAAGLQLEMDEWELDFVFSGSQKAWMCPPGLAIAAVGERAIAASKAVGTPRYFFDMNAMITAGQKGQTPATPPLSLLYALDAALGMIEAEGLPAVWDRHARVGSRLRSQLKTAGLSLLPNDCVASNTVTAFFPPDGLGVDDLVNRMYEEHGVTIAGGQGRMANEIVRIGHMGWVDEDDIDACMSALLNVMSK